MNTEQSTVPSKSNRAYWAQVVTLGLVVGLGLQFAQAAWTNPPVDGPTSGNVSGPITTSSDAQTKVGRLTLQNDLAVGTNATFGNFVSVQQSNGLCLGAAGSRTCKKNWDEVGVPAGAVMAFDAATCPSGWSPANGASGRVDVRGKNIIGMNGTYPLRGTGGSPTWTLTAAQSGLPAHDHLFDIMSDDGWTGQVFARNGNMPDGGGGTRITARTRTAPAQNASQAHPVMDPYVALLYCVKN